MKMPTKEVYLLLYRDKDARSREGMAWNAYTFDTLKERDEMVYDLQKPTSIWKDEAVEIVMSTIQIPVTVMPDFFETHNGRGVEELMDEYE